MYQNHSSALVDLCPISYDEVSGTFQEYAESSINTVSLRADEEEGLLRNASGEHAPSTTIDASIDDDGVLPAKEKYVLELAVYTYLSVRD